MRSYLLLLRVYLGNAVAFALLVVAASTLGYVLFADYQWFDALYMTFITLGTIGYGEVRPLDTSGRVWTMVVVVAGYGVLINITARFTSLLLSGAFVENRIRYRREKMIAKVSHHMVVVGFGRVGRSTAESAIASGRDCVVIETNAALRSEIEDLGAIPIIGDARDLETLRESAVERAAALVSALSDSDNLVVVATVRLTYPDLRIVARVNDLVWGDRLERAGANELVPVYRTAGRHLATAAVNAGLLGILGDEEGVVTEEFLVRSDTAARGRTIEDLMKQHSSVVILGVRREDKLSRWHEIDSPLRENDVLFAMGSMRALQVFNAEFTALTNP